jgi:hypothetical protein
MAGTVTQVGASAIATATTVGSLSVTASTTARTGTLPLTAGHLLVAVVGVEAGTSVTAIACSTGGWTQVGTGYISNSRCAAATFWKIAAGADAAPAFTSTTSGTYARGSVVLYEFSGHDATTPFPAIYAGAAGTTANPLTVTTTGPATIAQSRALAIHGNYYATNAADTWTKDAAFTNDTSDGGTTQRLHWAWDYLQNPSTSVATSCGGTWATIGTYEVAWVVVIAADPGITVVTPPAAAGSGTASQPVIPAPPVVVTPPAAAGSGVAAPPVIVPMSFTSDFDDGTYQYWNQVLAGAGALSVIAGAAHDGGYGAQSVVPSASGDYAGLRRAVQPAWKWTISGWWRVQVEGASGSNVPFARFYYGAQRLADVYRQNVTNQVWLRVVKAAGGTNYTYINTNQSLAIGTWVFVEFSWCLDGTPSVKLNGTEYIGAASKQTDFYAAPQIDTISLGSVEAGNAGTWQIDTVTAAGTVFAAAPPAAGAGTADAPTIVTGTAGTTVTAGQASGSGGAPQPAAALAGAVTPPAAPGTGTAAPPAVAATVAAGAAAGAGAAARPATAGQVTAAQAAGAGTASPPAGAPAGIMQPAAPAGAGTASAPAIIASGSTTVTPPAAAGAGTASAPSLPFQAPPATGAGTASPPAARPASLPAAGQAAGSGTAGQPAAVLAGLPAAGPASGSGTASPPQVLTTGQTIVNPPAAAGAGAAPPPAAVTVSHVTVLAGQATGGGAAPAPAGTAALTAAPPAATGGGTASPAALLLVTVIAAPQARGSGTASPALTGARISTACPAGSGQALAPVPVLAARALAGAVAGTGTAWPPDLMAAQPAAITGLACGEPYTLWAAGEPRPSLYAAGEPYSEWAAGPPTR